MTKCLVGKNPTRKIDGAHVVYNKGKHVSTIFKVRGVNERLSELGRGVPAGSHSYGEFAPFRMRHQQMRTEHLATMPRLEDLK